MAKRSPNPSNGEKISIGKLRAIMSGRSASRVAPFGWRLEHAEGPWNAASSCNGTARKLVENPREQVLLRYILDGLRGGTGVKRIASHLNLLAVVYPRGPLWQRSTIDSIRLTALRRDRQVRAFERVSNEDRKRAG